MNQLEYSSSRRGDILAVKLRGELNIQTATQLQDNLMGEVNAGIRKIVCNLEDVTYIASAGIGVLMSVSKTLQEKNGLMVLSSASVGVQKVFRLFGFSEIMHIFDSEEQAFSYFDSLTS